MLTTFYKHKNNRNIMSDDESWKKFCDTVDGVELKGRYMPDTRRFHWTYLIKADSYDKFVEAGVKVPMPDRRKIPSIVNDLYYKA